MPAASRSRFDHLDHVDVAERRGVRGLGWRVPFFASALLVAVGLWIAPKIEETPGFTELQEKQEREKAPAVEVFRDHKKPVLRAMGMRFSENITFYMLIVFALSYGEDELGISRNTLLAAIIICAVGSCIVIPTWGALTDRIGRRPVFLWGAIASVSWPPRSSRCCRPGRRW